MRTGERQSRWLLTSAREDLQKRATMKQVNVVVREQFEPGVTAHKSGVPTDSDPVPRFRASIFWHPGISERNAPDLNLRFRDIFNVPCLDKIYFITWSA